MSMLQVIGFLARPSLSSDSHKSQIDAASSDVVTRTLCLLALIAALMSLLYGCLYIIRFGTMKRMHKAAAWADVTLLLPFVNDA